jgi:hypothetical protein
LAGIAALATVHRAGALDHATKLIYAVCCLAGAADIVDEIRSELEADGIPDAIRRHDTGPLAHNGVQLSGYLGPVAT